MAWTQLDIERVEKDPPETIVYRLGGSFTDCQEAYGLLERVREDTKAGAKTVALNLTKTERITSGGIGMIAACFTSLQDSGGRLLLIGIHERYHPLFHAVGLWSALEHHATEEDAGVA